MKEEVWDRRVQDLFCLDCDRKMEYYGYENGDNLDVGKIIDSETYEKDGESPYLYLNFKCFQCKKKTSVMTH